MHAGLQGVAYNDKGQLFYARPVIYECCSAWTGCPDGKDCTQVRKWWGLTNALLAVICTVKWRPQACLLASNAAT